MFSLTGRTLSSAFHEPPPTKKKRVVGYRFKGVPKVFADREHALQFLTSSPGYVSRQSAYLKKYWPGLADEIGLNNKKGGLLAGITGGVEHALGHAQTEATTALHVGNKAPAALLGLPPDYTVAHIVQHPIRTYERQAASQKQLQEEMKQAYLAGDKKKMAELARKAVQYDAIFAGPGIGAKAGLEAAAAKGARATAEDIAAASVKPVEAIEELKTGLKGARSSYGKQKVKRSEEMARRSAKVSEAFRTIADPAEAQAAAGAALRGEHPKINFQGLKELTPENLTKLKAYAQHHPTLLPLQKVRVLHALDNAVAGGQPTPSELRLIEHVYGKGTAKGIAEHAASWGDRIINAVNIPRSLQSTLDVSGLTRQAFVAMTTHPIIWGKAAPSYIKAFRTKNYRLIDEAVKNDPNYGLAIGHVSFSDTGDAASLLAHEEAFASDYATKIPVIGRAIKGSAQGYTAFLNKLRMDMFSHFVRLEMKAGRDPHREDFLKSVGDIVNAATGRGAIHGRLEHMMPAANTLLYSPRLMLSRLNYFDPTWYVRLKGRRARIEALKGLFATTGYVTGVVTLLSQIPGVEVGSLNPLSSDFGKLRQGDTRVDVAAGFLQYIHLAAVLQQNAKISTTTGNKIEFGSGFGQQTKWDQVMNFFTNKAAPPVALSIGLLKGHDPVGNPVSPRHPASIAGSLFVPLSVQDAKDLYRQRKGGLDGITAATAGYGISALGFGLQTYSAKPKKTTSAPDSGGSFFSPGSSSTDSFYSP